VNNRSFTGTKETKWDGTNSLKKVGTTTAEGLGQSS